MQPEQKKGLLAILALVAVVGVLACRHGIRLPQESESALTAEIRAALNGDTEAAGKYAKVYAGLPHGLGSEKLKTVGDVKRLMVQTRESLGQHHDAALSDLCERELGFLANGKEPFTPEIRSRLTGECKRLETAFKAASGRQAPASVADMLHEFADRMEARK